MGWKWHQCHLIIYSSKICEVVRYLETMYLTVEIPLMYMEKHDHCVIF